MYWTGGPAPQRGARIPLGKANVVRQGTDSTVVSYGRQVNDALAVAEKLQAEGVSVEVVDLRTISPLDMDTVLASVTKTGRAVVVHEATKNFGPGAEVAAQVSEVLFGKLKAPVLRIGSKFAPVPFAKALETAFMPSQDELAAAVRQLMSAR
jgi:pyruvate dehydrogenase E1 component beta subunit